MATYVQPSSRAFTTTWTPRLLATAFSNAESGNMRLVADLCDSMISDDRFGSVLETRVGGMLGLELTFEASGDGRRRRKVAKALEAEEDWWAAFPEEELKLFIKWALVLGFCWAQIVPTDHSGRKVPRLEFWHPRNIRWDAETDQWYAKVGDGLREVPIEAGDGQWVFFTPYGGHRPWAYGLYRGLGRWWLLKQFAMGDAGRRSEKSGAVVAEQQDGEGLGWKARKELAADIAALGRAGVICPPKGFSLKLLENRETIAQNQGALVDMANIAFAVGVLGQNLTTEVSGGSFAAAKVHDKVEIQRIRFDAQTTSTCLHDQALEFWALWNFGSRELAPWPIWKTDAPTDQKERATVFYTVAQAIVEFDKVGYDVDEKQIEDEFGIILKKRPDPIPVQLPPAPPGDSNPNDPAAAPGAPANPNAPPLPPAPPAGAKANPKPEPTPGKTAAMADDTIARGAKGNDPPGQAYADRIAQQLRGGPGMQPTVDQVLQAVSEAESFAEAYDALTHLYQGMDPPTDLARVVDAALVLAELGGQLEVSEQVRR